MDTLQKHTLLEVARDAVIAAVRKETLPSVSSQDEELIAHCGCFVTLKNGEQLRGCIGQFVSDKPLINLVSEMGVSSSTKDPRFLTDPVTPDELGSLDVEISVLSPLQKTDDPLSLRLGIDGVYIKRSYQTGCFLPQVATETGWTKEQFLTHCCVQKAGLSADAWRKPDTEVFLFTADVFGAEFDNI